MFTTIDTSSATNTNEMFRETFANCTSLTGYIPPTAFPNTITPGSSSSTNMWNRTFSGTQLATVCPAGTVEYNTGFENDWGYSNSNTTTSGTYRVSCEPCPNSLPTGASWVSGTCNFTCEDGHHTESFDLDNTIGNTAGNSNAYIDISGRTVVNSATYGLTENGTFAVEYNDKGIIKGRARCSYQRGTNNNSNPDDITKLDQLPDTTGTYCWCLVDEYTPIGGSPMSLSGPWVFLNDLGTEDDCEGPYSLNCAWQCQGAFYGTGRLVYRSAVLRSRITPDACVGNTITINWSNASQPDIDANDAGTVTYGGDIRTPRAATIIPGKVFLGWKFSRPGA